MIIIFYPVASLLLCSAIQMVYSSTITQAAPRTQMEMEYQMNLLVIL